MAIKPMQLASSDKDAVQLVMPAGSQVDLYADDGRVVTYRVQYGAVVPRLTELPNILRALKTKFGSRLLEMKPTQGGMLVRLSKFGVVK